MFDRIREYTYAYGAVSPIDGDIVSLVLPKCNTYCMNLFLAEVSKQYPDDYILMVADNAAWHTKSKGLIVPENIEIFPLLPYTPELNPIEMIWEEIREKFFKNKLFKTLIKKLAKRLATFLELSKVLFKVSKIIWN